ncbi:hypothetical protein [Cohnella sp. WQ 127256]|uniref:hypothetical protein n=1 Tax=Cohnella sp. WQ 127256 TaxID=2938790 RepID=UPI0021178D00|nr:hypothetical protein [Cohnella sp. WQ 127256]
MFEKIGNFDNRCEKKLEGFQIDLFKKGLKPKMEEEDGEKIIRFLVAGYSGTSSQEAQTIRGYTVSHRPM